jgi:hypothetical protein
MKDQQAGSSSAQKQNQMPQHHSPKTRAQEQLPRFVSRDRQHGRLSLHRPAHTSEYLVRIPFKRVAAFTAHTNSVVEAIEVKHLALTELEAHHPGRGFALTKEVRSLRTLPLLASHATPAAAACQITLHPQPAQPSRDPVLQERTERPEHPEDAGVDSEGWEKLIQANLKGLDLVATTVSTAVTPGQLFTSKLMLVGPAGSRPPSRPAQFPARLSTAAHGVLATFVTGASFLRSRDQHPHLAGCSGPVICWTARE